MRQKLKGKIDDLRERSAMRRLDRGELREAEQALKEMEEERKRELTPEKIIKALRANASEGTDCVGCILTGTESWCSTRILLDAADIIEAQEAEIRKMKEAQAKIIHCGDCRFYDHCKRSYAFRTIPPKDWYCGDGRPKGGKIHGPDQQRLPSEDADD